MGGHGLEPRLRGLGETNINILLDGAYVHNACPNRMDPPTSFGAVESFDRVVVLKGVQTMRYGGGGSAGTILYQRETPRFAAGRALAPEPRLVRRHPQRDSRPDPRRRRRHARGSTSESSASTATWATTKTAAAPRCAPPSSKRDANFFLGWTPDAATLVELSYENNRTEDALFPGSGMDAP